MLWLFTILAFCAGAAIWVAIAAYIRVRSHMKKTASKETTGE
jgi:hypothetical protein